MLGLLLTIAAILTGVVTKEGEFCGLTCSVMFWLAYVGGAIFLAGFVWLGIRYLEEKGI